MTQLQSLIRGSEQMCDGVDWAQAEHQHPHLLLCARHLLCCPPKVRR